jgi:hypothetical protein
MTSIWTRSATDLDLCGGGKPKDIALKFIFGCHFCTQPRVKLAPTIRLSSISQWMRRLVLKNLSSWPKFSGGGFLGSITEYMVLKDFRQPSTDSPTCWTRLTRFYPGNAHTWGLFIHEAYVGAGRFNGFRQKQDTHKNLPRFGPPEGKDLHPACWSCIVA